MMDQYLRPAKSQSKWYRLFSDQKSDPSAVSSWNVGASKLNSSYSRIGRKAGISSISIMASLSSICVRVCVNIFSSKSKMPRDMLLLLKDTLTIEDDKS